MAYFRTDLCLSSPESYTLEEKKPICNDMAATSIAQLQAMREDFQGMPPEFPAKLLDMPCPRCSARSRRARSWISWLLLCRRPS